MPEYELQVSDIAPAVCYALLNILSKVLNSAKDNSSNFYIISFGAFEKSSFMRFKIEALF